MQHYSPKHRHKAPFIVTSILAVVVIGFALTEAAYADGETAPCVPQEAWTETIEHEAVTHNEEVFDHWQRYSWTGGPHTSDNPPPFPDEGWQPNVEGDPHGVGVEGAYFRSNGNSGNGDWFYLEAVTVIVTVVDVAAWTETIEHPAVVCPVTEEPTPTETPTTSVPTPSETVTVTPVPVPNEEPSETPQETPEGTPENDEDPVTQTETHNHPNKTVKVYTHESGKVTRSVIHYDKDRKEEGL